MFNDTNTWALSPRAIFIRMALLLLLGVLMVAWIDTHFSSHQEDSGAMVHQGNYPLDSLQAEPLGGVW